MTLTQTLQAMKEDVELLEKEITDIKHKINIQFSRYDCTIYDSTILQTVVSYRKELKKLLYSAKEALKKL